MSVNGISLVSVKVTAPSIFATKPHKKMSERYAFISTASIVERLVKEHNFEVVSATQRNTRRRNPEFTRHQVILRPISQKPILGEVLPQVLLNNSHDGQSKFVLRGGLFRLICTNGLVTSVADAVCAERHLGDAKAIIDSALQIVDRVGKVQPVVAKMMKKKLTDKQVASFAIAAAKIAYDEPLSFDPQLLLAARRPEDEANTVWQVFNRIQENIIRGGVRFESRASGRQFATRGLTHIGRTMDMNTSLWTVAEKLAA